MSVFIVLFFVMKSVVFCISNRVISIFSFVAKFRNLANYEFEPEKFQY